MSILERLAFVAATAAASCSRAPTTGDPLDGTSWVRVPGDGATTPGVKLTVSFAKGQVSGYSGCNDYGGSYQRTGEQLHITDLLSTQTACADPARNDQESEFVDALSKAQTFQIAGDTLRMFTTGGTTLVFTRKR